MRSTRLPQVMIWSVAEIPRVLMENRFSNQLLKEGKMPQLTTIVLAMIIRREIRGGRRKHLMPMLQIMTSAVGYLLTIWVKSYLERISYLFYSFEDDAQNGPRDHVDAHRSPAYLISPYVKRKPCRPYRILHPGMIRTIELILGMKTDDAVWCGSYPMWRSFYKSAWLYNIWPSCGKCRFEMKEIRTKGKLAVLKW